MGAFDDLVPSGGNALALPAEPRAVRGNALRRDQNTGAFDDLIPGDDGVWSTDAQRRVDFGAGLRDADDPASTRRNALHRPAPDEGTVGNATRYAKEFGKAVVRGAAELGSSALKFGAAAQTVAARDMQRYVRRQLDVQDKIDRGEAINPSDDHYGYAGMRAAERQATRQRLTNRLTEFELPGGVQDRDLYQAGTFVSEAGHKTAPAAAGWEDSTTANLGQGVGSVVAGLPVAVAGPGAAGLVFGAAGGGEALERAINDKAAPDDQLKAALLGVAPGATDVAPIELLLRSNRFTAPFSSQLANAITRIGGNAFVEGIQEGGQQFLQNLIAREVYKPEQSLSEGIGPNTALGAGVGGIAGTAVELARLFGGRRGAHLQQSPPTPKREAVGSGLGATPAGGRFDDLIPQAPAGAVGPAAPAEPQGNALSRGFQSASEIGEIPTNDNDPSRNQEPFDNGLGPEAALRNALAPTLPDFGFTSRLDRRAYGGSGEAPAKRQRRVDKSTLEYSAERLLRDVRAYEDEMRASGALAEDIAAGIEQTFGFEVTPDQILKGNGWWRLEEIVGRETGKTTTGRTAKVALPPEVEDLLRGDWRHLSTPEVAKLLHQQYGLSLSSASINNRRGELGVPSTQQGNRLPSEIVAALRSYPLSDMSGEEAARYLGRHFGRQVTRSAVNRWRRNDALKRAAIQQTMSDILNSPEMAEVGNARAAEFLNEQLAKYGVSLNERRVATIRAAAGLRSNQRPQVPRDRLIEMLRDPSIADLPNDAAAEAITRAGVPVSRSTVHRVRTEMGEPARPSSRFAAREGRDSILAFLRSEEAQPLTHAQAAQRLGTDREYIRNLRREYGLQRPDERASADWSGAPLQFLVSEEGQRLQHGEMADELNRRFPGNEFTHDAVRARRREYGLTQDRGAPDARELLRQPAFNESAYRESHAELQMLVGGKSGGISDARYARLISDRFGRHFTAAEVKELRERAREAFRQMTGRQPTFAITAGDGAFDDLVTEAEDIASAKSAGMWPEWADRRPQEALLRYRQAMIVAEIAREIESRRLPDLATAGERRRGMARPIDWESPAVRAELEGTARRKHGGPARTGAIGPLGGPREPDFAWPPAAINMIRQAEGRLSFDEMAREISEHFGTKVTRDMVSGKVRRLRKLSRRGAPLLAASDNPEGWFARFKRGSNAQAGGSSQVRDRLDQAGREVSRGAPREGEVAGAGAGRDAAGGARGSVGRFDVGRYAGRVVETPNVHGLRQRRYYLFSPTSGIPGLTRSPDVVLRVLKSMRTWVAKAHVSEISPGQWRVLSINVRGNRQRRGIGTQLYDALNRDLGVELEPSPSMTRKLYRFWQKRDLAAVARYQRIGDIYHAPAALRSMKRVNDELLRNPPTARDAAYARRYAVVINEAVAKAEEVPSWARSDVDARNHITTVVRDGGRIAIPDPVIERMLEGIDAASRRLPSSAEVGALARVAPLTREPSYPGADVVATFRLPDGGSFDVELPLRILATSRAFYDNFTGRIALTRFGLFSGIDQSIAGEIDHEAVHLLRRQGFLRGAVWDRLVGHAHSLRLLDGSLATYLKMVGDPAASKADPDLTLRDAYEGVYKNSPDFDERMDQEAVAHMRELYARGHLLPQEVEPVRDILDALNDGGRVSPGSSGAFDDLVPGARSDENGDYRDIDSAIVGAREPRITTPGGEMEISVRSEVVDLADLKQATGELQPRDRSRAESAIGVRQRAAVLDPSRLMPDRVSDSGAPIVTRDGTVLSGNGRVLSIGEAYRDPALADRAAQYRTAVIAYAEREGLGNAAEAMRYPVLVSRITDDLSRDELARFADLSNRSSIAQMASPERAMRDARSLGPEVLGMYRGGDFTSPDNREFYRAFMDGAVSANERGSVSRDGVLTKEGEDRMSAAVLAGAYGDPALLSRMLESTDDNMRSVTGALRDAAGGFVRLKQAIAAGEVDAAFDITPQLAEVARRIGDLRTRRVSLQSFLGQQDAFNRLDPVVEDLLRGFHNDSLTRALSREKLTELLTSYAEEAVKHKQNGLIPDETTPAAIVQYAAKRAARSFDDFLPGGSSTARGSDDRTGSANEGQRLDGNGNVQSGQAVSGLTPPAPAQTSRNALAARQPVHPRRNALLGAMQPPIAPPPPPGQLATPPIPPNGGAPSPANPGTVRALNSWRTRLTETLQNSQERMRILVDRIGQGRLADTEDPYLRSTLYHGRLGARVRFGNEQAEEIVSSINRQARASRISHEDMRDLVNDYLVAQHAPERNAIHGDGAAGMTNAEAHQILADINARADAAAIRTIGARVRSLHDMSLDALRGADVISDQLYDRLRSTYQHHVPLNRLVPGQADVMGGIGGKGFDVYSTGIKRAKGSDLEVLDVLGNVLSNFEQAMVRSEKNLVDLSSLAFLRRHTADLAGFMEEQRPPVIGTASNGQPIYQQTSDPRVLHLFENGRPLWIRFSDARLAASFKASNSESLPSVLRWVATVTRVYSSLATRFNPEFALPNKLRDLQETMIYMGAQRQIGAKGAAKVLARDPSSTKAIIDYLAGRNTTGTQLYQEMMNAGGTTGGMGLSTRESVQLNIDDLDRLAQSSPRRFAKSVVQLVDNWNTIFEDSTRLSVYRSAREQGLSRERAAFLAKEASINFNRMGTAGPVVNGLYMFANASIQGSAKMMRSMRNPKVAAAVGVTIAAAIAATSEWNDELDPQWRDKVSKWDRLNGLPIVLPNENGEGVRYVTIPVSWGMKPIMVAAAAAYDAARGIAVDWATALADITTSMIEAYNPVGGTDFVQALTPTVGDTPIDIARNRKWSGGPIRPDQDRNLPYDKQYFLNLKDTKSGRAAIKTTETLHDYTGIELSPADLAYAIEQYIGGTGRSIRKTFDTLIGVGSGNLPPADEFPMLSRFYRERSQEEIGRGAGGKSEELNVRLRQQSRQRFDQRSHVDDILRSMEGMSPEERRERLRDLRGNRSVYERVRDGLRMQDRGLTWQDKQILRLGIDNGERARFIADELKPLTANGRAERLKQLRQKELVTPEVLQQVRAYLAGRRPRVDAAPLPPPGAPQRQPNALVRPQGTVPSAERRNALMP